MKASNKSILGVLFLTFRQHQNPNLRTFTHRNSDLIVSVCRRRPPTSFQMSAPLTHHIQQVYQVQYRVLPKRSLLVNYPISRHRDRYPCPHALICFWSTLAAASCIILFTVRSPIQYIPTLLLCTGNATGYVKPCQLRGSGEQPLISQASAARDFAAFTFPSA